MDPAARGPHPRAPSFLLPCVVRHVRGTRERARGAGLRDEALRRAGHGDRRPDREPARAARPRRRHDAVRGAIPATPSDRARERVPARVRDARRPRRARPLRGLHRVRPLPVGLPGRGHGRHLPRPGGARLCATDARGIPRRRPRRAARLGRPGRRSLALSRGVRVHGGVPERRPSRPADHDAAQGASASPARPGARRSRRPTHRRLPREPGGPRRPRSATRASRRSFERAPRRARCRRSCRAPSRGSTCGAGAPDTSPSR